MKDQHSVTSIYEEFGTSSTGLTSREAHARILKYGHNTLAVQKKSSLIFEFLKKFAEPMTLILFCASIISLVIGQFTDAIIIIVIVLLSSTLEFFQEHAAQKALEKLRAQVATTATVLRDGKKVELQVEYLTIGDVIELSCGDIIPGDCRVVQAADFFVNESAITGESFPVEKAAEGDSKQRTLFMGTTVISGSATAVITAIGVKTEFGKVSTSLAKVTPRSEYELGVTSFGYFILKLSVFLVLFIFLVNTFKNGSVIEALLFAVAIAVGVVPELLPMIMTVTMAMGAQKMARKGVLVKQLSAIPNFGSMDVLCTDKTGTLTENKIALVKHITIDGKPSEEVLLATYLTSHFQTGIRSPMDDAVLAYKHEDIHSYLKVDEVPYDFIRKRMTVVVKRGKARSMLICKGAPEEILPLCSSVTCKSGVCHLNTQFHAKAMQVYEDLSQSGFRVLAVAQKSTAASHVTAHDEGGLTLIGFVAFLDPAKKDVIDVVKHLNELGIEMKVITGDNELVTKKICMDVGIELKGMLLGREIDHINDEALQIKVKETTIFARCSPDQKNRVIMALKAAGHVVGYMGDGINDAPSLKNADVGISVNNAVDIAKESAQIVLLNKSLEELRDGVIEGRKTFANSMKYIMMACSSNFGNMFSATVAILYLPFLPMLPLQIILNNFIYDFSQITIPTDNVDAEWTSKPRKWNLTFIRRYMIIFGPLSSLFDILLFFVLYGVMHVSAGTLQTSWFLSSLATQTLGVLIIRTRYTPFIQSKSSTSLFVSAVLCLAVGWMLPFIPLGEIFKFETLAPNIIAVVLLITALYLITLELVKRWFYKMYEY